MTIDERTSKWRNALSWAIAGFLVYAGFVFVIRAVMEDGMSLAAPVLATTAAALLLASALVAFSKRHVRFGLRSFGTFVFVSALAIAAFLLARAWLLETVSPGAIGLSATVALILGLLLVAFGLLGLGLTVAAHSGLGLQPREQVELIVEQGRVLPYSCVVIAAMGLTLVLLSLAGPDGVLSPGTALVGAVLLLGIATALSFAIWPRIDELSQTLSRETGNAAYYLIVVVGGGWAILAHLGFVRTPTPLDWLTMLTVIMFAASVIAAGRRGMLRQPAAE
jgi:hypothetical protein